METARSSEEIDRVKPLVLADYKAFTGLPAQHFYCPMLCRDENVDLCMGHLINKSIPKSSRTKVLQRADIDNFYGAMFEGDLCLLMELRGKTLADVMADESLRRRLKPTMWVEGKEVKYYPEKGDPRLANHTRLDMVYREGCDPLRLTLALSPEEVLAVESKKWSQMVVRDCRLAVAVSMIKAAYLTMFKTHGYRWALSSAGLGVGRYILGRFFEDNRGKQREEVLTAARSFFQPYLHMVRPMNNGVTTSLRGTIEDNTLWACFGSSGFPFATLVWIRLNDELHGVLMPAADNAESAATYEDFLKNDKETLRMSELVYHPERKAYDRHPESFEVNWTKTNDTIGFQ
jgi:hypothetical protein